MAALRRIPLGVESEEFPPPLLVGGGFRFRQRRPQPRSGPCGWRPSRVSPPPPPPYCLCEERGERPPPLPLPPQVRWEPPGEVVGCGGGPRMGQRGAVSPRAPSGLRSGPSPSPAPPSPHTHQPRPLQPIGEAWGHPPGRGARLRGQRLM